MRQGEPAFGHHLGEISKAELVSQIPAHAEHDDLLAKVPALEESVHFRVRSSALSFDGFANDYAVSKQFAPKPFKSHLLRSSSLTAPFLTRGASESTQVPSTVLCPALVVTEARWVVGAFSDSLGRAIDRPPRSQAQVTL